MAEQLEQRSSCVVLTRTTQRPLTGQGRTIVDLGSAHVVGTCVKFLARCGKVINKIKSAAAATKS